MILFIDNSSNGDNCNDSDNIGNDNNNDEDKNCYNNNNNNNNSSFEVRFAGNWVSLFFSFIIFLI
jgi:hypothetical protein